MFWSGAMWTPRFRHRADPSESNSTGMAGVMKGQAMTAVSNGSPLVTWHVDAPDEAPGWARRNCRELRAGVTEHGAVLVRGLKLRDSETFAAVSRALADELMPEREGFAHRDEAPGPVYSSSRWPDDQIMCMHHELSYAHEFPALLILGCLTAPNHGGCTAVADSSAVLDALPSAVVDRLETEGWLLTRNYGSTVGLPWAKAFGTSSRDEVERYCRAGGIEYEWRGDELRTRQRRPALIRHPVTGRRSWFNQISFLSEWSLDPDVRDYLLSVLGPDGLSFNTAWGNGEPFTADLVHMINEAYARATRREPWQAGDLLLVDNVRMAHNREAFEGDRQILLAFADPVRARLAEVI
ncbi:TauD/TfdA family dioxygenase [Streptomyces sp. NBC_01483]|uniref:TauD/TfdA family dioxygenase n=1 Tax=Streptomyces sp. NBC_01483 TaxID=2903883 RepID=UPI002E347305|nr:TauD/TfdA family dioxygenase [Streptomyces sp. NBC_01483]